ncbi:adenylate/guanylate cyclase domain-containing protein [Terrabacter sp. NPDC080008]|uniref:ATP-binding protein n=1 Tax=Terrabacter sp. NPDC080008 TaxID=3155176 RepID=UPI003450E6F4
MGTLPSGTVTLLFSDIEGSTVLLGRLGPAYADALGAHRRILRSAWAAHRGTELGTEGDSFFVAFEAAGDAVSAAVRAQRELTRFSWPEGERVRVRMGIHTGAPTAYDGGYVGMDVHRCARVAGAAHGGQIVISEATAEHLGGRLAQDVGLLDLGLHQLKDLPELERLHQVVADGLPRQFPPLKSLGAVSRLPSPATPLVGRQDELAQLAALVGRDAARLVTLTGSGGSGKTRLALELARRCVDDFPDGVHFIPLAEARTADQMWDFLAEGLGTAPGRTAVLGRLGTLRLLLVFDNLEQLDGADGVVAQILRDARGVTLVVTSRSPLHLAEEHEYPVSPLAVPRDENLASAQASPAVQLFVQQGQHVRPDFELRAENAADVMALCRGLDGLPLAIEIASARLKVLTPHALVARLNTRLDLSTTMHDVADRQRTLRNTIAWSYDLLPPGAQSVFARLGVFDSGADLAAVSAVLDDGSDPAGADPLEAITPLVDASLLMVTENHDGEPRVELLETVRAFAVDRLVSTGALDSVRAQHARHYLRVVETVGRQLRGDRFWQAREELDAEQSNVRAALRWCLDAEAEAGTDITVDRSELALRLCWGLCDYWTDGAKYVEARQWLEPVIDRAGTTSSSELARCLSFLTGALATIGEAEEARRRGLQAVSMLRDLGDTGYELAEALRVYAVATHYCGDPGAARLLLEEALEVGRGLTDGGPYHRILDNLANVESHERNYHRSLELHEEAIALAQAAGHSGAARVWQHNRACVLRLVGRVAEARDEMLDLIPAALRHPSTWNLITIAEDFGAILADLGKHHDAVKLLGAVDALRERSGYPRARLQESEIHDAFAASEACLSPRDWQDTYQWGRNTSVNVLLEAHVTD